MYNHSKKNIKEKIIHEPTEENPGRVRSLHATKGWKETRIDPLGSRVHEVREKLGLTFKKSMKFGMGG